jgi:hypothetical protein
MKRYLIGSASISAGFFILYYLGRDVTTESVLHPKFPTLIFFFFLQSIAVSWLFYLGEKAKWESPVYAMVAMTFRFLTGLFFLVILFVMKIENVKPLMLQFVGLYLVYLIFELFAVLPNLRRN